MYPIYALWAHPRSMSTAIERIMRERGDLDCAHEPFMYDYYLHRRAAGLTPHFDAEPDHPRSYEDIRAMLLRRADAEPVFIKDMSYYVFPHILEDSELMARLRNAFLIRRPQASLVSYFRIDPDFSSQEAGLDAQWHHFQALQAQSGTAPPVIRAEDVRANPRGVIGRLWSVLGLSPCDSAFDWQGAPAPKDWEQVGGWHGTAMATTGILPPGEDVEIEETRRFEAAAAQAPHLRDYLQTHQHAYAKLSDFALSG